MALLESMMMWIISTTVWLIHSHKDNKNKKERIIEINMENNKSQQQQHQLHTVFGNSVERHVWPRFKAVIDEQGEGTLDLIPIEWLDDPMGTPPQGNIGDRPEFLASIMRKAGVAWMRETQ